MRSGGLSDALRAPIPDAPGGMIRQAGQHVGEPSLWIDVVELGGGDEGVDDAARRPPSSEPARSNFFYPWPVTVHSAHVGEDFEVHYRWHPYFGRMVNVRRVEQRATGQFLRIRGPLSTVITIPGWMVDPIACAEMTSGPPQVDLAALLEPKRLVTALASFANFPGDGVARENADEAGARSCTDLRRATEPDIRAGQAG